MISNVMAKTSKFLYIFVWEFSVILEAKTCPAYTKNLYLAAVAAAALWETMLGVLHFILARAPQSHLLCGYLNVMSV